jgi:hypothetical protein
MPRRCCPCLRHPAPLRGFCVVPYVWYTSSLRQEKQKGRLVRVYSHWAAYPRVVLSYHKRRPLATLHSRPRGPRERSQRTLACSTASCWMTASVSYAKRAMKVAATWRRANRTPWPAQSDRNSARPCCAAVVRSGCVSAFCNLLPPSTAYGSIRIKRI